jgi:hypothetical protein
MLRAVVHYSSGALAWCPLRELLARVNCNYMMCIGHWLSGFMALLLTVVEMQEYAGVECIGVACTSALHLPLCGTHQTSQRRISNRSGPIQEELGWL